MSLSILPATTGSQVQVPKAPNTSALGLVRKGRLELPLKASVSYYEVAIRSSVTVMEIMKDKHKCGRHW